MIFAFLRARHLEPNGILAAAQTGSAEDFLTKERAVLLRCAPDLHIVDMPDSFFGTNAPVAVLADRLCHKISN